MKKSIILTLAILPFAGLVLMACAYSNEFRSHLTVKVDKTEASMGIQLRQQLYGKIQTGVI